MTLKDEGDNLAALLTPPGAAAIAVVRLRGSRVADFLKLHFSATPRPGRAVHGVLRDRDREIDDPVVMLHDDETFVDINLHGGEWVVRECLELARRAGFQIVENADALLDAADTIEREMLSALPQARTQLALRTLLNQPNQWRRFTEETRTLSKPALQGRVREILQDESLWWLTHPPRVAIIGIPNVGKSTLANALFGQHRSIIADIPGTTRDWVGDFADIDGLAIHLLDTPGQHDSSDELEQAAIAASRREIERADLTLLVLDPTQPFQPEQERLHSRHPAALLVINKTDLNGIWDSTGFDAVRIAALTGQRIDELRSKIRAQFGLTRSASPERPLWWTERQRAWLQSPATDDR